MARLQLSKWEKLYNVSVNPKRAGIAVLILNGSKLQNKEYNQCIINSDRQILPKKWRLTQQNPLNT